MPPQVFAFGRIPDDHARSAVCAAIRQGKSRFGMWDQKVSLREKPFGRHMQLLHIKPGDWIVHVNAPNYGRCIAARVSGEYGFDDGIACPWGMDFRNYLPVDPASAIEFDRQDKNISPSVNLSPMRRLQRVLAAEDFVRSIANLRQGKHDDSTESRSIIHLRAKAEEEILPRTTALIQTMNKSKEFEIFLKRIFDKMPNVSCISNGFGWRTDHGADLIVDFENPIIGVSLPTKLVVQAKSYTGDHNELHAVDQIVAGIKEYKADGGLLITTANATERLENEIQTRNETLEKEGFGKDAISLMAGTDVAKFVIRHAPELLIGEA